MAVTFQNTIVVTGHYGSGKTNLSLNLALKCRDEGQVVSIADLDVVNPYFRTADFRDMISQNKMELVASDYAGSSLDVPALSAALDPHIGSGAGKTLIIDVGGDDAGAYALGRYSQRIKEAGYTMLYVLNAYRYLMKEPEASAALLREVESASRLNATHLVNCSNLGSATTPDEIRASRSYADQVSALTGLPIAFTAVRGDLAEELDDIRDLLPVHIYVTTPWNEG